MSERSYELRGKVARLTIDRPQARNALNKAVRDGLRSGFERFATQLKIPPKDFIPYVGRNVSVDKPVIAAVNGIALRSAVRTSAEARDEHP